ncbi:hypothetical protein [Methylorubrum extorquens]|uniref:hypothetical protein n=1 Tax=Methylorubrum extorquens TaxID=408 RepID=UPI001389F3A5|nr:hypothetical protein [Methylorubrum extorquens]MCP1545292.1 hypothetical protein [Methylorubrum extorquens]MCP1587361.1 hypothetical protein [Methylorubrum extorquens]
MGRLFSFHRPDVARVDAALAANVAAHRRTATAASELAEEVAEQRQNAETELDRIKCRLERRRQKDPRIEAARDALKLLERH